MDAAQLKFGKYGGGITRFETSLVRQSAGFEVNDLGFLRRADIVDWSTWAALSFRDARRFYRWAQLNANHWESWNTSGRRLQNAVNVNGHIGLHNNWDAHGDLEYNHNLHAGETDKPILLKRGFMSTVEEWLMAAEHIAHRGNNQIIRVACHIGAGYRCIGNDGVTGQVKVNCRVVRQG